MFKEFLRKAASSAGLEISRSNRPGVYDEVGLRSSHRHAFTESGRFQQAYNYALEGTDRDPAHHDKWRTHIAIWAAMSGLRRHGDFVECGTARAFLASAILTYSNWNAASGGRSFYLVDTYEGFSKETMLEEEIAGGAISRHGDRYLGNYDDAARNVAPFKNVKLIKGRVPEALQRVPSGPVAFLHLDMNSAVAEREALVHFWPLLTPGATVLMDDYCHVGYEPQRVALDETAASFGAEIASLPTGQGILVK